MTLNNIRKRAFGVGLTTIVLSLSGCGAASQKSCESDNDCPGQQLCVNNTCSGAGQTCNNDFDCAGDEYCVNNFCTFNGQQSCETDFDCSGDSVCEDGICSGYSSASIPETTKILDDNAASSILNISNDKSTLTFSSSSTYAQNLKSGDVIVAGVYDNIPVGLLRKVTSKGNTGSEIIVNTQQATLEDAIESGTFNENISFTPEYLSRASPLMSGVSFGLIKAPLSVDMNNQQVLSVDFEGVELYDGSYGNVTLDGDLTLGLEMGLKLKMSSFKVKYVNFTMEGTEDFNLMLSGEFEADISKELPAITPIKFSPIVFMAGYVPVVIVPELSITFGLEAQGSLSLETSVSQGMSATYGLEYNGSWTTIKNFDDYFDYNAPTFSNTSASAEAYAKPELKFKLYGVAGPSAGAKGYVKGEIEPLNDPWCSLSAGLKVNAGFEVGALGKTLINYENILYEYEKELYTCGGGSTCTDECSNGETKCYSDGFKVCDDYNGDGCVEWGDVNYCDSDEYCDNGECVPEGTTCTDECDYVGEKICGGGSIKDSIKECGDPDDDGCLEWVAYNCNEYGVICVDGECVPESTCTPSCSGKECGDDGCGNSCGSCGGGESCLEGICTGGGECTPTSGCPDANCVFYDDFSGDLCKWNVIAGTPELSNGNLVLTKGDFVEEKYVELGCPCSTVEYKMKLNQTADSNFQMTSGDVSVEYDANEFGSDKLNFRCYIGESKSISITPTSWNTIKIMDEGDNFNLYLNGILTETVFCGGGGVIGSSYGDSFWVGCYDCNVSLDNIKLNE